jgi:hypothetical protein
MRWLLVRRQIVIERTNYRAVGQALVRHRCDGLLDSIACKIDLGLHVQLRYSETVITHPRNRRPEFGERHSAGRYLSVWHCIGSAVRKAHSSLVAPKISGRFVCTAILFCVA